MVIFVEEAGPFIKIDPSGDRISRVLMLIYALILHTATKYINQKKGGGHPSEPFYTPFMARQHA